MQAVIELELAEAATQTKPVTEDPWAGCPRFAVAGLEAAAAAVLAAAGLAPAAAKQTAEILVAADLRGVESHGIARVPAYVRRLQRGLINLGAALTTVRETAATLALDADNGFGPLQAATAMERSIAKAEHAGLCLTTVRRSNHFGICGYYALMATRRGLGGLAMTNASPLVVPTFGRGPMLGTNPLAIAVPTGEGDAPPLVVDMSTSTVAWGKVELARRAGRAIPAGWAVDDAGLPTTDPWAARWLTPLGDADGHKGYALGVLVDVLCGPLAGGVWSAHVAGARGGDHPAGIGHTFMAWRIDAFRDPADFYAEVQTMIAELRASPPAPGHETTGVLVPGDPEAAAEALNRRLGVPLRPEVVAELRSLADSLGVSLTLDALCPPALSLEEAS